MEPAADDAFEPATEEAFEPEAAVVAFEPAATDVTFEPDAAVVAFEPAAEVTCAAEVTTDETTCAADVATALADVTCTEVNAEETLLPDTESAIVYDK